MLIGELLASTRAAWGTGPSPGATALPVIARLGEVAGVGAELAASIISETGLDMTRFPGHLASWAGLCGRTIQSGARTRSGKGQGNAWLRGYLGRAAIAAPDGGGLTAAGRARRERVRLEAAHLYEQAALPAGSCGADHGYLRPIPATPPRKPPRARPVRSILGTRAVRSVTLRHACPGRVQLGAAAGRGQRGICGCEAGMELNLPEKVAAFCRELGDENLLELARQNNMEQTFVRARRSLQDGRISSELEADLDSLDSMVRQVEGEGLYPADVRGYARWPGIGESAGAQWWTCPSRGCAGRGRVVAGQRPPVCAATGESLEPRPLQK